MKSDAIDSESHVAGQRLRRHLKYFWDWSRNDGPYSPLFCLSLLLVFGLIVKIGR